MKPIVTAHDAHTALQALRRAGEVGKLGAVELQEQRRLLEDIISSVNRGVAEGTIGEWAAYRLSGMLNGRLQNVVDRLDVVEKLERVFRARLAPAAPR